MISNIDIMTPITDDPYLYGKITTCNCTNDNFAMNSTDILSYLLYMALPTDIPEEFPKLMLKGARDFLRSIDSDVSGGHTTYSEWPFMGGCSNSIMKTDDIIEKRSDRLMDGDKIILTKPLGTQGIMAGYRLLGDDSFGILDEFDMPKIKDSITSAEISMTTSLRPVSLAIHEYRLKSAIKSMTDITGFGLSGHLGESLEGTNKSARISSIPIFPLATELSSCFGFDLKNGRSAETAGPMMLIIDQNQFTEVLNSFDAYGISHFEIGDIIEKKDQPILFSDDLELIEVPRFGR